MAEAVALAGAGWAVSVAGWVASPIISKLLNEGFSYLGIDTAATIDKLEATILPQFQEVINAAERSEHRSSMDMWLRRLKETLYEAEDAIDLYKYGLLQRQVENGKGKMKKISEKLNRSLGIPTTEAKELKNCLKKLEKIALEAKVFRDLLGKQAENTPGNSIREPMLTTSKPPLHIFGREADCEYLLQELLEQTASEPESSTVRSYSVHSIVGAGGAGKTTLAQLVYNDERVTAEFDFRIWLSMTRGLDVDWHTRIMVEAASKDKCPRLGSLDILQDVLINWIRSKKVLIVMDDVWWDETMNELRWEQFVAPLANVKRGSKILLTSRTKKMPRVLLPQKSMPIKELEDNPFLSLFMHHAFGVEISSSYLLERLERMGRQIAKRLCRSPLAAKTVGSQLCKKLNERFWRETLESDMLNDTSQSLLWSYQNLNAPTQRCFSYCSIFPKGYLFEMEDMVKLWVAEGFIQDSSTKRLEDVGEDYFQELLSVFFFQTEDGWSKRYFMHDLFHDLAERVSKDDCFRIEDGQLQEIPLTACHLSVQGESFKEYRPQIEKLKSLRTLILVMPVRDEVINSLLKGIGKFKKLRVLKFCLCSIEQLPNTVGDLVHLRYLGLDQTRVAVLPTSLQKLYSLQTLKLNYTVTNLPRNLNKLISLRHLVTIGENPVLSLSEIGKLTSLQQLSSFKVKKEKGYEIGQLMLLNEIGGSSRICDLKNVEGREKAAEAKLKDKKYIESLSLIWGDDGAVSRSGPHSDVLDGLKPHQNLKALTIAGYKSSIYPSWILQEGYLENLDALKLSDCPFLEVLPPISSLFPCLHELSLISLPKLTHLPVFPPSLKSLDVSQCWSILFSEENLQKDDYKMRFLMAQNHIKVVLETIPSMKNRIRRKLLEECSELQILMEWDNYSKLEDIGMLVNDLKRTQMEGEISICEAFDRILDLRIEYICSKREKYLLLVPSGLESLRIYSCYITDEAILHCLVQLTCLKSLALKDIRTITTLPPDEVVCHMVALRDLSIVGCDYLISIGGVRALVAIKNIDISFCSCLEMPGEEGTRTLPPSLESIDITGCDAIKHFQVRDMPSLSFACFRSCEQLKSIVMSNIASLRRLEIKSNPELCELCFSDIPTSLATFKIEQSINVQPFFKIRMSLPSLRHLEIGSFDMLSKLLPWNELASLEILRITHSSEALFNEERFENFISLRNFSLMDCKVQQLPRCMKDFSSLRSIALRDCPELLSLPDLPEMINFLLLANCPAIFSLPNLPKCLWKLEIFGCPALKRRCQEPDGEDWPKVCHVYQRNIA